MARVPGKKETLLQLLQRGVAMVHLDARRPGVEVPAHFAGDAHLRLNLSYRYGIPDFDIGEERVRATLSFGGRPFQCILPWSAIFGITSQVSGDGQVWPEDLPVEVMHTVGDPQDRSPARKVEPPKAMAAPRPRLAAISSEFAEPAGPEDPERAAPEMDASGNQDDEPKPDGPPPRHLRLVR